MRTLRNELVRAPADQPLFGDAKEPFFAALDGDIARYVEGGRGASLPRKLLAILRSEGLWALCAYRLGRYVHTRRSQPQNGLFARAALGALWVAYCCVELWVSLLVDIQLHVTAQIAPGLYVGHFKSIHVGPEVRIGRDCNIGQMSWIAAAGPGFAQGAPVIGERVYVGVGAKVIGSVRVGSDVAIGANAVVFEDVPQNAVVVGNPARVVSQKGSSDFISVAQDAAPAKVAARPQTPKRSQPEA